MSSLHGAGAVGIEGAEAVEEAQHDREPDGHLRRRHRQDEEEHHLAVGLLPARAAHHERQPGGVKHDLDGHQLEDHVPPHQQPGHAQREQHPR